MDWRSVGFTLIELILVIVILGVLAATALPRFIDLSKGARKAKIEGAAAMLGAADSMVFAKAVALGMHKKDRDSASSAKTIGVEINGQFVHTIRGHPWLNGVTNLSHITTIDAQDHSANSTSLICNYTGDFCQMRFSGSGAPANLGVSFVPGGAVVLFLPGMKVADNCFAYYIFDRADNSGLTGSVTSGC